MKNSTEEVGVESGLDFVSALCGALGMNWAPADLEDRPLHVVLSFANYGKPSSVLIEFRGSPARFPVFMTGIGDHPASRTLVVNGTKTKPFSKAHAKACLIVERFLEGRQRQAAAEWMGGAK
ncbi:MAG TPA: hypothetical protein PKE37_16235 [Thiomonas arsenitoxydans]|uniref:hypothetical protein n=1 Tax=Thiomonas arsenitoxydans (strain DSM 22701 / CIP 110005 / 3As) TaxID=426114 RepID=UPI002C5AD755|nr:hypothetical protein [Thiomonas arsenitoxydans]HML83303.1 hypothetical protein [Thiomonas arsenitoxydans]